jgi:hypothetical protein
MTECSFNGLSYTRSPTCLIALTLFVSPSATAFKRTMALISSASVIWRDPIRYLLLDVKQTLATCCRCELWPLCYWSKHGRLLSAACAMLSNGRDRVAVGRGISPSASRVRQRILSITAAHVHNSDGVA